MEETKKLTGEEKNLRRVFDYLSNYVTRKSLKDEIKPLEDRINLLQAHKRTPESVKVTSKDGTQLSEIQVEEELASSISRLESLNAQLSEITTNKAKQLIHAEDLNECLIAVGKKHTKKEIEDMIWEVDENLDYCIDWEEFKLMYSRNIVDKTGLEPFQFFNVVQFMMYDKDYSGKVSIDETMTMLYQRYGKEKLESQMKLLFGNNSSKGEAEGNNELSFAEYLKAVSVRMPRKTPGVNVKSGKGKKQK